MCKTIHAGYRQANFIDFFKSQRPYLCPERARRAAGRPDPAFYKRGHEPVQVHFPRRQPREAQTRGQFAEVHARVGQAQRPRRGGARPLPPHVFRNARQLVVRRLLQKRGDPAGDGSFSPTVWKLPKDRLFVTVYKDDDEAIELLEKRNRHSTITGSCGSAKRAISGKWARPGRAARVPKSTTTSATTQRARAPLPTRSRASTAKTPGTASSGTSCSCSTTAKKDGTLTAAQAKHVDTGMGFERVVAVLQGVDSNYHTDLFMPIITRNRKNQRAVLRSGAEGTPFRVVADHIRALVFAITDGAFPSNEGRGYVVRRLLRRAARFGRELGFPEPFMYRLVPRVIASWARHSLKSRNAGTMCGEVIRSEEERFGATLEQGIRNSGNGRRRR